MRRLRHRARHRGFATEHVRIHRVRAQDLQQNCECWTHGEIDRASPTSLRHAGCQMNFVRLQIDAAPVETERFADAAAGQEYESNEWSNGLVFSFVGPASCMPAMIVLQCAAH